jgi:uncharacterized membrane protein YjdF
VVHENGGNICELLPGVAVNTRWINAHSVVALGATMIMMALSATAETGSTYRVSFAFLAPLIWTVYALRRRIYLHWFHFALLASAVLLHNLGVFGYYRREFFGLQFDTYVHFYFGFCAAFLVSRALDLGYQIVGWRLWIATTLGILGFGAIHELIEWASSLAMGPERGMLKVLGDDPYDTQKDLFNNLLGTLLSLVLSEVLHRALKSGDTSHTQA